MQELLPQAATTGDVTVRVSVSFLPEQSEPGKGRWFWAYRVRIENDGRQAVQLVSREWMIADGRGIQHEVRRGRGRRAAGDRARRRVRLCLGLPTPHADRVDGGPLFHGRGGRSGFPVKSPLPPDRAGGDKRDLDAAASLGVPTASACICFSLSPSISIQSQEMASGERPGRRWKPKTGVTQPRRASPGSRR